MVLTLTSVRKTSLVPALAVLSSFFLVAGQVFNCCRLNETVSESFGKAAHALSHLLNHSEEAPKNQAAIAHHGCHGHILSSKDQVNGFFQNQAGSHLQADASCLSETGFTPEGLKPSEGFTHPFSTQAPAPLQAVVVLRLPRIEKPRPQNKSSPPVYLLTLRILV